MAKDEAIIITDGLWAGINNEQVHGDDLNNPAYQYNWGYPNKFPYYSTAVYPNANDPRNGRLIKNAQMSAGALEKILAQANANQTVTPTATTTTGAGFDAAAFFSENKWLVLGAVGVIGYLMFAGGGGGLAESTVIKRFNKR